MAASAGAPDNETGAPAPASASAPVVAVRPRILIVEDEPALLRALRINLRARSYEVLTAAAGRPALAEAAQHPPDAVILDLGLPDLDGVAGHPRAAHLVPGPGDRAVRADRVRGQDRRPGRGRRRLRDQAVLHGGTAGPAARRAAPRRDGTGRQRGDHRLVLRSTWRARTVSRDGRAGPAHPHRVAAAGHPACTTPASWSAAAGCSPRCGGPATSRCSHYLRFHMAGLRRKLEDDPARPHHLLTEPGMGYRFQP